MGNTEAVADMVAQRDAGWVLLSYADHEGTPHWLIAIWTYGRIEVQFQNMLRNPPFDDETKRLELLSRLNNIADVAKVGLLLDATCLCPPI